jgi:hypothetical protein
VARKPITRALGDTENFEVSANLMRGAQTLSPRTADAPVSSSSCKRKPCDERFPRLPDALSYRLRASTRLPNVEPPRAGDARASSTRKRGEDKAAEEALRGLSLALGITIWPTPTSSRGFSRRRPGSDDTCRRTTLSAVQRQLVPFDDIDRSRSNDDAPASTGGRGGSRVAPE